MSTKFSKDHVWARLAGDTAFIGITHHAQETLGDIVFVDLPTIGKTLSAGEIAGVVESVKTAADVFSPLSGVVTEVNEALRADPSLANTVPQGDGWFFKLAPNNAAEFAALMDEATYLPFAQDA
jgi:glycine cleavage system H protein